MATADNELRQRHVTKNDNDVPEPAAQMLRMLVPIAEQRAHQHKTLWQELQEFRWFKFPSFSDLNTIPYPFIWVIAIIYGIIYTNELVHLSENRTVQTVLLLPVFFLTTHLFLLFTILARRIIVAIWSVKVEYCILFMLSVPMAIGGTLILAYGTTQGATNARNVIATFVDVICNSDLLGRDWPNICKGFATDYTQGEGHERWPKYSFRI